MTRTIPFAALGATLALGACASMDATAAVAPQPARPVDTARFYTGVWHEIGRNPMKITDGCVAGITAFSRDADGRLIDRDSCRMGDPVTGKEKVFAGPVDIDPANSAKFTTHYKVFGVFSFSRTYWILDNGDDLGGGWFVTATPDFKNVSTFTRDPQLSAADRDRLNARVRALGYDPVGLEFPAQPPR